VLQPALTRYPVLRREAARGAGGATAPREEAVHVDSQRKVVFAAGYHWWSLDGKEAQCHCRAAAWLDETPCGPSIWKAYRTAAHASVLCMR
jgi:hypothetical protein